MKIMNKLFITVTIIHFGSLYTFTASEFPPYSRDIMIKKPIIIPENVTPQEIEEKKQEITELKNQLLDIAQKNPTIQQLLTRKKATRKEIKYITNSIQKIYSQNKSTLELYFDKTLPYAIKKRITTMQRAVSNKKNQLKIQFSELMQIKNALKKAAPARQNLIKSLHEKVKELQSMQLIPLPLP